MARAPLIEAPPPRYRVVERGRRLVVIDARTGDASTAHAPTAKPLADGPSTPSRLSGPVRTAFDGRATLVTHPLYDAKGPRTLMLSGEEARLIGNARTVAIAAAVAWVVAGVFFPVVLALPLALANGSLRRRLRGAMTRFLDRYDAPSAG